MYSLEENKRTNMEIIAERGFLLKKNSQIMSKNS